MSSNDSRSPRRRGAPGLGSPSPERSSLPMVVRSPPTPGREAVARQCGSSCQRDVSPRPEARGGAAAPGAIPTPPLGFPGDLRYSRHVTDTADPIAPPETAAANAGPVTAATAAPATPPLFDAERRA